MKPTIRLQDFEVTYQLVRSSRRRTVALQIDHDGLQVRAPQRVSQKQIDSILNDKSAWIARKLNDWARRPTPVQRRFETGELFPFLGQQVKLDVVDHPTRARTNTSFDGVVIRIEIDRHLTGDMRQTTIRKGLERWYRREAGALFPSRIEAYAQRLGKPVNKVIIRDQKRRWGSCDSKGIIRLNWRLIGAEPELIDYVCAHEVAHLAVHNHSPSFWTVVGNLMPDWKKRRQRLNDTASVFVPF